MVTSIAHFDVFGWIPSVNVNTATVGAMTNLWTGVCHFVVDNGGTVLTRLGNPCDDTVMRDR